MGPSLAEKTALRLGSSSGEFYESAGRPTGAEFDQQKAGLARDGPVSCLDKLRRSMGFRNILLGQVLSLLVASMSISAASLEDRGVSLPCLMNFLNYAFVFVFFSAQLVARMFKTGSVRLRSPLWKYARFAFVSRPCRIMRCLAVRAWWQLHRHVCRYCSPAAPISRWNSSLFPATSCVRDRCPCARLPAGFPPAARLRLLSCSAHCHHSGVTGWGIRVSIGWFPRWRVK